MRYCYFPFAENCFAEGIGNYQTFGICCCREGADGMFCVAQVSDISPDRTWVQALANLCTRLQLRPVHLEDVVINALE